MDHLVRIAVVLALCANTAFAQPYPSKPVRVIVPYPSGGIVDLLARAVTEKIASGWGQPILVEGRPGADSNLGTEAVAKSPADGYTWLMTGPAVLSNPSIYSNLAWSPLRDFQGVGVVVWNLNVAVVPATLPVHCSVPGPVVTAPVLTLTCEPEKCAPSVSVTVKLAGTETAAPRSERSFVLSIGPGVPAW